MLITNNNATDTQRRVTIQLVARLKVEDTYFAPGLKLFHDRISRRALAHGSVEQPAANAVWLIALATDRRAVRGLDTARRSVPHCLIVGRFLIVVEQKTGDLYQFASFDDVVAIDVEIVSGVFPDDRRKL